MGYIESWGRGIEKICDASREDDLPMLEFTVNSGDIMAPSDRIVIVPDEATDRVTDGVTDGVTDEVTDAENKVLSLLVTDPGYSYVSISGILDISKKTVAERIMSLKEKGIIKRIGNNKTGHWEISSKYNKL